MTQGENSINFLDKVYFGFFFHILDQTCKIYHGKFHVCCNRLLVQMTKSLRKVLLIDITGARNLWTLFTLYVSNHCIWYSFVNNIWKALLKSDGAGRRNVRFYVFGIRPCHPHLRFNLKLTKAKTEDRLFLSNKSLTDYVTDCRQNVSLIFWDPKL